MYVELKWKTTRYKGQAQLTMTYILENLPFNTLFAMTLAGTAHKYTGFLCELVKKQKVMWIGEERVTGLCLFAHPLARFNKQVKGCKT